MFEYDHIPEGDEIREVREELQELADFIAGKEGLGRVKVFVLVHPEPYPAFIMLKDHEIYIAREFCQSGRIWAYSTIIHEMTHLVVQREWSVRNGIYHWKAHGNIFKTHERRILSCFGIKVEYENYSAIIKILYCNIANRDGLMDIAREHYSTISPSDEIRLCADIGGSDRVYHYPEESLMVTRVQIYL